jgi:DHA1 family tetracycline resistance protein-like MFS transporter
MSTSKALPLLFLTLLLDLIGIGMVIPVIPSIFTDATSPSFVLASYDPSHWYFIAGLVLGMFGIMQFIAAPILGELSDMYGRKKLLALGVGILALSQMIFAAGILVKSLALILISRTIGGLGGANFSIAQAAIADISEPHNRARNFGLIGTAFGLGFILGPVLGGYIANSTGSASMPFFVAGVLGIINLISVSLFLPETHHVRAEKKRVSLMKGVQNLHQAFTDKEASTAYKASFLYMIGFACFTSFTGIYLTHKFGLSEAALGTYFGIVGIWIVITQAVILRFVTKVYNEKQILRVTFLCLACALVLLPLVPSMPLHYLFVPLIAIPQGLSMANMSALISKSVSKEKQGAALGINGSLGAFAQGFIPTVIGVISSICGVIVPFLLGGLSIAIAWYVLFFKKVPLLK